MRRAALVFGIVSLVLAGAASSESAGREPRAQPGFTAAAVAPSKGSQKSTKHGAAVKDRDVPDRTTLSAQWNLAPDQALYMQEYVRRRAFPDTMVGFIPSSWLLERWRDRVAILPPQPLGAAMVPCRWTHAGPTNVPGRVTGIAITKQLATTGVPRVIVTTVGGVWRSMNGGRGWDRVSDNMKPGVFGAVAVTPGVPSEVFVGGGDPNYQDSGRAGGPGIWLSTSGGDPGSWRIVGPPELDDAVIFRFQIDPAASHDVYVATSKGVYRGDRSGGAIAWSQLKGASAHAFDAPTSDIAVHFPVSGSPIVYAGVYEPNPAYGRGIWKFTGSPTSGSWNERWDGISNHLGVIHLALAPSAPNTIYAKITDRTNRHLLGIYKTTCGGEPGAGCDPTLCAQPWCNIKGPAGGDDVDDSQDDAYYYDDYNGAIAVHPADANVIFVGNKQLFRTGNGRAPWTNFSRSMEAAFYYANVAIHDDQHAIAFDPDDPRVLWVGGDGGVFRSTPWSSSPEGFQRWEARSHGMRTTEFWGVGTQQANVTPLLGGMQDNGTGVTFGNRTWYARYTCDGAQAALDAANSVTVYESCNGNLGVMKTVLPGLDGAWTSVLPPTLPKPQSPLAVDVAWAGHLLNAARTGAAERCIALSPDAKNWYVKYPIANTMEVSCVAIAPPTGSGCGTPVAPPFNTFYAGLRSLKGETPQTKIVYSGDGGATWDSAVSGVPLLSPNAIAVDRCDPRRAFAAFGGDQGTAGEFRVTQDGGANWDLLPFPPDLPRAPATGVAIDPFDPNIIYGATAIGVYRGRVTFSTPPSCTWERFNEGLPGNAVDVSVDATSIEVNEKSGTLVLGTLGYGAFQRDIRPGHPCAATLLSIRDNVFDRGEEPSPSGEADPEHPICLDTDTDPVCDSYGLDFSDAASLQWWHSPDIRVDLRCPNITGCACQKKDIEPRGFGPDSVLDAVEVESCPTETYNCPAGMMRDRNPQRGCVNRVYVQVTNRGQSPGRDLRVMAMWADASAGLPPLPPDFWSAAFPTAGSCQAVNQITGWHALDPANPCKTIAALEPDQPQVVYFDWTVPMNAATHTCVMALVESADDRIPSTIRGQKFAPWEFVPQTHQIGLRNLHVVDGPLASQLALMVRSGYRNYAAGLGAQRLLISRAQLDKRDSIGVLLPKISGLTLVNVDSIKARLTPDERAQAAVLGLDTTVVYRVRPPGGRIEGLSVPPDSTWRVGIRVRTTGLYRTRLAPRFTVMAMRDSIVLGGNTYMLRFRP